MGTQVRTFGFRWTLQARLISATASAHIRLQCQLLLSEKKGVDVKPLLSMLVRSEVPALLLLAWADDEAVEGDVEGVKGGDRGEGELGLGEPSSGMDDEVGEGSDGDPDGAEGLATLQT